MVYEKFIFLTDVKPENTLYNKVTQNTTIIDLGGALRLNEKSMEYYHCKEEFPHTQRFIAPELYQHCYEAFVEKKEHCVVNLNYCILYTFGKIIE